MHVLLAEHHGEFATEGPFVIGRGSGMNQSGFDGSIEKNSQKSPGLKALID